MTARDELRRGGRGSGLELVVIVASLGGAESAATVLGGLPGDFPLPVLLLQHGTPGATCDALVSLLQRRTDVPVRVARDLDVASGPGVAVIPHGYSATVDPQRRIALVPAARGTGGDALLRSAAESVGAGVVGVVLTGLLRDGSEGVRAVKRNGGRVLVEEPSGARAGAMPSSALATGCVDFALPKSRIASALVALALAPGGAELFAVPTPSWASLGA
jgi:two-component system chemotaxis response regulator CheB